MKILFSNLISASSPSIHLFVFLALIINFFSVNPVGAVDPYFQLCNVPRRCGNQTIRFPFYIKRLEGPVCGYPGFDLACDDIGRSILYFSGESYVVRQIFYQNQSLLVSNTALSDPEVEYYALNSLRNLSLPVDFVLVPNQKRVFLHYSCSYPSFSNYVIGVIGVDDANYYFDKVLAIPEDDKVELNGTCRAGRVVVVPVRYWGKNKEMSMREVLSRGFMLNWRAKNCTLCESTGGRCGFDNHFKCYCPDKPHAAHCDDHVPGQVSLYLLCISL
ncbi:Wall-associated receptor kinase [Trema orientale]|uniref:non-specific serine/threonine protein kinase n=1 Tax=Trema orientale TaxID=63057 RepID=A0A2P5EN22_TREOI|nr:Wall-associated receptor kinase [Trema orientale]